MIVKTSSGPRARSVSHSLRISLELGSERKLEWSQKPIYGPSQQASNTVVTGLEKSMDKHAENHNIHIV